MSEKVINSETATTIEPSIKEAIPEKKERKPRQKSRSVEEIINLPIRNLSDREKTMLIIHLKAELETKTTQYDELQKIVDSTFTQRRMDEENYKAMENYYKTAMKSVALQMDAAYSAVKNITGGIN